MNSAERVSSSRSWTHWMRPFAVVNGFVLLAAALSDALAGADDAWWLSWPRMWLAAAVRDGAVVVFLTAMTQGRARIGGAKAPETRAATAAGWRFLLLVAAPCDAALLALARRAGLVVAAVARASRPRTAWQIASAPLHFVALSFAFELVFDLIHYLTHRTCHEAARRSVGKRGALGGIARALAEAHATHHRATERAGAGETTGLAPISTYEQHPLDVLFCNALPALGALGALRALRGSAVSRSEFGLLWSYKAYVEVAGHTGVHSRATSFPQCVWLPRALGIALRTVDHDAHHTARGRSCNYAKRFTLWDRAFGTYAARTADDS